MMKGRLGSAVLAGAAFGVLAVGAATAAGGEGVRFFRLASRDAFLAGTLDGLSVDPLGTLRLADRAVRLAEIGEPFLFAAAEHPDGWVLGTGNDGKVLLLTRGGELTTLFSAPEPEIFAVWSDADGTVYAGSSPDGKVYRIRDGSGEPFFDPGETYIWDLERAAGGELLVATGTAGRLYRVAADGTGELLFDSEDTHLRSLEPLPDGDVLVGTAGEGLILRVDPAGRARTLFDADQPEVVALTAAPDGSSYAALLASEASLTDLSRRRDSGRQQEAGEEPESEAPVKVLDEEEAAGSGAAGSRPAGYDGPRSEVVRITSRGRVETVWRFDDDTVYSLLWRRDRLWVGTGLEGKLYSLRDGRMVLEKDVDERQVVALMADRPGPAFATTNAAALYRLSSESERQGSYTSPALDAGQVSEFGSLRWRGRLPKGGGLEFSARSGMSAQPDATWSGWSRPAAGAEIPLSGLPAGRYLQWRVRLQADGGGSPELGEVTVSYLQANLPPRIVSLEVLDPGQILVPAAFNPSNQVFEPAHPNRDGIFTTLEAQPPRSERRLKTLWKGGYRTLRWQAEDPNDDELQFAIDFRRDDDPQGWLPVAAELEDSQYGFDATALPDGVYRFRLRAGDRRGPAAGDGLEAVEVSEAVLVDHSPPELVAVSRQGEALVVELSDRWNPLLRAELSVDAQGWHPVAAADGLLDGKREQLRLEPPADARLVLLRVTDAALNVVTFDLSRSER